MTLEAEHLLLSSKIDRCQKCQNKGHFSNGVAAQLIRDQSRTALIFVQFKIACHWIVFLGGTRSFA